MTYAVLQDLVDRFGSEELAQRSDRDGGLVIDTGVVDRALADADAEIDGYLAARYALPLASVPGLLQSTACHLARYHLLGDAASDEARKRYDDAVRLLKGLASGAIVLPGAAALAPADGSITVAQRSPDSQFPPSTLAGY